jgi:protein-S-isoprenylcysteine O-methyltransferase Ste14
MKCRQCGTEIADKAIVCYRCGTATTEAKFKAPPVRKPRSTINLVSSVLAVMLLAIAALYMQRFVTVGTPGTLRWLMVVLAAAIVALRLIGRRTNQEKPR